MVAILVDAVLYKILLVNTKHFNKTENSFGAPQGSHLGWVV